MGIKTLARVILSGKRVLPYLNTSKWQEGVSNELKQASQGSHLGLMKPYNKKGVKK